jgi:biotin synthase
MEDKLFERLKMGEPVTDEELLRLITWTDPEVFQRLCGLADSVREQTMGSDVHLRGLIEFSNICRNDCCYCGLRRSNSSVRRYRMTVEEILETARLGVKLGYGTVVLQSGEDLWYDSHLIAQIICKIKELGVAVTLSLGEREPWEYSLWREAGADRYLLRHETADFELYRKLNPGMSLEHRVFLLRTLKQMDYQVGSGFMVGLPGQTPESLVQDLRLLQELDVEMAGLGPFICNPETPLEGSSSGTMEATLTMVALTRLLLPLAHIPATTALGSMDPKGRERALQAGANVIMPNLTPVTYREDYQLYPGKICLSETADVCRGCLQGRIESIGRRLGTGPGHSPKWLINEVGGMKDEAGRY